MLTSSVTLKISTLYPPPHHHLFFLLYLFYILYPLNWLTILDHLNTPRDYSRCYHSVVNYLSISLLLLLVLLKLLHHFRLISNSRGTCVISYLSILNKSPMSPPIIIFHVLLSSHLLTSLNSLRSLSSIYVLDLLLS